jgi:hypothetical protein
MTDPDSFAEASQSSGGRDSAGFPSTTPGFDRFAHFVVQLKEDGGLDVLGEGGMGVTYRAFDTQLERPVALKRIHPYRVSDRESRSRFLREAKAAGRLQHPNIASVLFQGEEESTCYYVMELVAGEDLHHYIQRAGPLAPRHALPIARQIALAIGAAWESGILHRDLKPANVMLTVYQAGEPPHVKVIDFGLAKQLSEESATLVTGGFLGTPEFASPEQCEERTLDVRSDLYALGVTLWYMLVGSPPFTGSFLSVVRSHAATPLPFERWLNAPEPLQQLLETLLAKDPDDRPASPQEAVAMIDAVTEALRDDPRGLELVQLADGNSADAGAPRVPRSPRPAFAVSPPQTAAPSAATSSGRAPLLLAGAALILAAAAVGYVVLREPRAEPGPMARAEPTPPPSLEPGAPAGGSSASVPAPLATPVPAGPEAMQEPSPAPSPTPRPEPSPQPAPTPTESVEEEPVLAAMPSPEPTPTPTPAPAPPPASGTPFENSLGMRFLYQAGAGVWSAVHETRVRDYRLFVEARRLPSPLGSGPTWRSPGFLQGELHPVVCVTWQEAERFCAWLTEKEAREGRLEPGDRYRLPHRRERDHMLGITPPRLQAPPEELMGPGNGPRESGPPRPDGGPGRAQPGTAGTTFPLLWAENDWPPVNRVVNAADRSALSARTVKQAIGGYDDRFPTTSPVGSFPPTPSGLCDVAGNVWEFVADGPPQGPGSPAKTGGSWKSHERADFQFPGVVRISATERAPDLGFRCVLERATTGAR